MTNVHYLVKWLCLANIYQIMFNESLVQLVYSMFSPLYKDFLCSHSIHTWFYKSYVQQKCGKFTWMVIHILYATLYASWHFTYLNRLGPRHLSAKCCWNPCNNIEKKPKVCFPYVIKYKFWQVAVALPVIARAVQIHFTHHGWPIKTSITKALWMNGIYTHSRIVTYRKSKIIFTESSFMQQLD